MTHSVRTHHHPYTPSPANSQPTHTPSPSTNQPFPPPPPPPLPTAAPTTPNATSFKHSPTHQAPPAPPSTVPFPQPPLQDSWHSTDSHWDSNALHGHQLHRTIQPTQWSRRVGIVGLPIFDVFPWLLAYHGTADKDSEPRKVLWPHSDTQHRRVRFHNPPVTRNSGQAPRPGCYCGSHPHIPRHRSPQQNNPSPRLSRPTDFSPHSTTSSPRSSSRRRFRPSRLESHFGRPGPSPRKAPSPRRRTYPPQRRRSFLRPQRTSRSSRTSSAQAT